MKMLAIAEDFKVETLKKRCENYFLGELSRDGSSASPYKIVTFAQLAEKYSLVDLNKKSLEMATRTPSDLLENVKEFWDLTHMTRANISLTRLKLFEETARVISKRLREVQAHCTLYHKNDRWADSLCNKCLAGVGKVAATEVTKLV